MSCDLLITLHTYRAQFPAGRLSLSALSTPFLCNEVHGGELNEWRGRQQLDAHCWSFYTLGLMSVSKIMSIPFPVLSMSSIPPVLIHICLLAALHTLLSPPSVFVKTRDELFKFSL